MGEESYTISEEDRAYADSTTACGMPVARYNTIALCKKAIAEGIPGDFVECGINAGAHPACMAYVSRKYGDCKRRVHLFDSFEGLPQAGLDDTKFDKETLGVNPDPTRGVRADCLVAELYQVQGNMIKWGVDLNLLVYHKGWLQEVLPVDAPKMGPIAVLRVDVDLHDSTLPVFEYLYPLVSPSGYVISDDWGEDGATPARLATLKVFAKYGWTAPKWERLPVGNQGTVWWQRV